MMLQHHDVRQMVSLEVERWRCEMRRLYGMVTHFHSNRDTDRLSTQKVVQFRLPVVVNSSVGVIVGWWFRGGRTKDGLSLIFATSIDRPRDAIISPITIISCQII